MMFQLWVAIYSFTNFSLVWGVWLSVWFLVWLALICFSNIPRLKPSLRLFIFGCILSCNQYWGMFYVNKNKTRLIQVPATLPNMFYAKDKARTQKTPTNSKTYQLLYLRETNIATLGSGFVSAVWGSAVASLKYVCGAIDWLLNGDHSNFVNFIGRKGYF